MSLSEVHNVLEGYFIPTRIIVRGILRYLVLGESCGRVLIVILEPTGTNEMLLITAFDAPDSKKNLYESDTGLDSELEQQELVKGHVTEIKYSGKSEEKPTQVRKRSAAVHA